MHMYLCMTAFAVCASRYTGKERDTESGLDYFGARYYSSSMGRYMSPDYDDDDDDPEPVPYADLENPQTLNLYGYVMNNPLQLYDPTGHSGCCDVLPTMEEVDAGIAYLEGGAETVATVSAGAVVGTIGVIGSQIFAPSQMGNDPAERAYLARIRATPTGDHRKDARPSTKGKHQKGQARKKKDRGGEKGDARRQQNGMYGRKPPPGHKGPWPPRDDNNNFNMMIPLMTPKDDSTVTTTQEDHLPPPPPQQQQQPQ